MSGNNEFGMAPHRDEDDEDTIEMPLPNNPRNPHEFMMPQMPEQIGEVDIDAKAREVLLGLDKKLLKELMPIMLTPDRKPPDVTALWNEALGQLAALSRFVRDRDGKFYDDGIHFEEFLTQAEPLFVQLQNWAGIFKALGEVLGLGALLVASLHGDVKNHLGRENLKTLVPEDYLQLFRMQYEANKLESMKGIFANEPARGRGNQSQGFV